MKEWLAKLNEWWTNLAPREKKMVGGGGAALGLFILYQFIWSPYLASVAELRAKIESGQKLVLWMQSADKEIARMSTQSPTGKNKLSPIALLSIVQKDITRAGLEQQLTQLKQASNDSIELHFQKVEFDRLIKLLTSIAKEQGAVITQLNITADASPGIVNADVQMA